MSKSPQNLPSVFAYWDYENAPLPQKNISHCLANISAVVQQMGQVKRFQAYADVEQIGVKKRHLFERFGISIRDVIGTPTGESSRKSEAVDKILLVDACFDFFRSTAHNIVIILITADADFGYLLSKMKSYKDRVKLVLISPPNRLSQNMHSFVDEIHFFKFHPLVSNSDGISRDSINALAMQLVAAGSFTSLNEIIGNMLCKYPGFTNSVIQSTISHFKSNNFISFTSKQPISILSLPDDMDAIKTTQSHTTTSNPPQDSARIFLKEICAKDNEPDWVSWTAKYFSGFYLLPKDPATQKLWVGFIWLLKDSDAAKKPARASYIGQKLKLLCPDVYEKGWYKTLKTFAIDNSAPLATIGDSGTFSFIIKPFDGYSKVILN